MNEWKASQHVEHIVIRDNDLTVWDCVAVLEGDVDDLQRKLAKLRGSNSETQRLKAIRAEDHTWIASLE